MVTTEVRGVRTVEDECPEGWVVVSSYVPHSCPWDCYGNQHLREVCHVLGEAGLSSHPLRTRQTRVAPMGSGPNGRVRFGDDMLPGVYRVAVPSDQYDAAMSALSEHHKAVNNWLHNRGPMPNACRQ